MPFNAIVHAPGLRPGARLNIAEADQTEARQPGLLTIGAEIRLRIGVCAPALANGRIVGCPTQPESVGSHSTDIHSTVSDPKASDSEVFDLAVLDLAVGEATWRLRRGQRGGVTAPGLVSEAWYVVGAIERTASPIDHRPEHLPGDAVAKD